MVHHGGIANYSSTPEGSAAIIRSYQDLHMDQRGWDDIGYSFLIGEDGRVYEGRGWDRVGAHAPQYNHVSIGVCFLGDFSGTTMEKYRPIWSTKCCFILYLMRKRGDFKFISRPHL
jgi:N-acetylmuramoyl-L-alanine amidase